MKNDNPVIVQIAKDKRSDRQYLSQKDNEIMKKDDPAIGQVAEDKRSDPSTITCYS